MLGPDRRLRALERGAPRPRKEAPDPWHLDHWLSRELMWLCQIRTNLIGGISEKDAMAVAGEIAERAAGRRDIHWREKDELEYQDRLKHKRIMMVWTEGREGHSPDPYYLDQYDRPDGRGIMWHHWYAEETIPHMTKCELHPDSAILVAMKGRLSQMGDGSLRGLERIPEEFHEAILARNPRRRAAVKQAPPPIAEPEPTRAPVQRPPPT